MIESCAVWLAVIAPDLLWHHDLVLHDGADAFTGGTVAGGEIDGDGSSVVLRPMIVRQEGKAPEPSSFVSAIVSTPEPFDEALVSWNVDAPPGTGFRVELRVRKEESDEWSPYLAVGEWGAEYLPGAPWPTECSLGRIDVDYFVASTPLRELQYRITAGAEPGTDASESRIVRVAVCFSRRTVGEKEAKPDLAEPASWQRRLPVPFLSQKDASADLSSRICSPTSLAMLLAYRGKERDPLSVAERAYDPRHAIYGNWPRNIQAAYSLGVPGYLTRFSSWSDVQAAIAADQPLIISIAAQEGELPGAPYTSTAGHLLVLTGFDSDGDVHVNDPAAPTADAGRLTYPRASLDHVWMRRGGTAYVLMPGE